MKGIVEGARVSWHWQRFTKSNPRRSVGAGFIDQEDMATGIWDLSSSSVVCTKLQSGGDISGWEWRWKGRQGGCGRSGRRWTDGQCRLSTRSKVDRFRRFEVAAANREAVKEFALPSKFVHGKMLSEVSSWGIGGPAKMFVEVTNATEMASVLRFVTPLCSLLLCAPFCCCSLLKLRIRIETCYLEFL